MPPKKSAYNVHQQYFDLVEEYQTKYGSKTIVFMQCGAFFEIYGIKMSDNTFKYSNIDECSKLTNLNIANKHIDMLGGTVVMCGFREYSIDKYVERLVSLDYTIVVYVQSSTLPSQPRTHHATHSPGTYISYETSNSLQLSNNIMCLWLDKYNNFRQNKDMIVCGMACCHMFTGKTSIYEYETEFFMNPTSFDELERYISMIAPNEILVASKFSEPQTKTILQYSGLKTQNIHLYDLNDDKNEMVENSQKQTFIQQILSNVFGEEAYNLCGEFRDFGLSTQAFSFLINYIREHNPDLVRKIALPEFTQVSNRMILANHTLKQLNIIDDSNEDGKQYGYLSSVSNFLNRCLTCMGKRHYKNQITNPVFDESWLNTQYNMIEIMNKEPNDKFEFIRKNLIKIQDLERMGRQIVMKKIYPNAIYILCNSIQYVREIYLNIENQHLTNYLLENQKQQIFMGTCCDELLEFIHTHLDIEKCSSLNKISGFDANFMKPGIYKMLDKVCQEYQENLKIFHNVHLFLNNLMKSVEKKDIEYVNIHETERSGSFLQITKKRGQVLNEALKKLADESPDKVINFFETIIPYKDIRFVKGSASKDTIEFPQLIRVQSKVAELKERVSFEITRAFLEFLTSFETSCFPNLYNMIDYITHLDVLQNKSYISRKYNYNKPVINSEQEKSSFDIGNLRHVLIEHIQQNETYVTNDVTMGNDNELGMLLFGTNAVGKTSFIRALGITIILAQSGNYVPCSHMIYKPYTAIFSRIIGNDNLFRGLSTFAVEMSELRVILKMANESSLILGDELCSGTENESALSIFTAGIQHLHKSSATYLFATHFHEIVNYDEIKLLEESKKMVLKHMSVHYDNELKCLVYDRKLKDGSGERIYGLEVCKSLYLENQFLEDAFKIRSKYFPNSSGELEQKTSTYNSKKIRGKCEICSEALGEEIHHLEPQKIASKNGIIKTENGEFHKNHLANLISVCEKCHDKLHKNNTVLKKKKTTKGYKIIEK